jgi:hypothetical protein
LITDENSQTYQTLAYAPYGESLVNVNNGSYDESYKFTGYERDAESGLDYAHARSKRDIMIYHKKSRNEKNINYIVMVILYWQVVLSICRYKRPPYETSIVSTGYQ